MYSMWQPIGVNGNVTFNADCLLDSIITFVFSGNRHHAGKQVDAERFAASGWTHHSDDLAGGTVRALHSQEASLEDVFFEVAGVHTV